MELRLSRLWKTKRSTIGELSVDGDFEAYTLEDPERDSKIAGETAIPCGTYNVSLSYSPRFNKILPLVENVKGFEGVRIHSGNTPEDTDGCILVGKKKGKDVIWESRNALASLLCKLLLSKEPITLVVS